MLQEQFDAPTDDNALFIEIKNFGHTPAFDAIGHFNWKEAPYGSELSSLMFPTPTERK